MNKFVRSIIILLISTAMGGCILAPIIDSVSKLGVTGGDRRALFEQRVKDFNEALYWGHPEQAVAYVDPSVRAELVNQLRKENKGRRLVESKIDWVEFNDGVDEVSVDIVVKYFDEPVYIVQNRKESQRWRFSYSDGWQLLKREVSKV